MNYEDSLYDLMDSTPNSDIGNDGTLAPNGRTFDITTFTVDHGQNIYYGQGSASILVRGDVHGDVLATGGGSYVEIRGNVYGRVGASGGSAKIHIIGDVYPHAVVKAKGGAAKVIIEGTRY